MTGYYEPSGGRTRGTDTGAGGRCDNNTRRAAGVGGLGGNNDGGHGARGLGYGLHGFCLLDDFHV